MHKLKSKLKFQKAFTLVELLVVVVIIGILAGIAYPNYQNSVTRSRRADAKAALMDFANAMERHFTENNTYCGAGTDDNGTCLAATGVPTIFSTTSPASGTAYYNLTIPVATATTFTLRATPIGTQAGDGILELTNTGVRGWDRNGDNDTADAGEQVWE